MTVPASFRRNFYRPEIKLTNIRAFRMNGKYRFDIDFERDNVVIKSFVGFCDTWPEAWERARQEAERMESER